MLSDQLREAIRNYGTVYRVAKDAGINHSVIQRFMKGERDLYLATAERLAEFLGMRLTKAKSRRQTPCE